MPPVEYAPFIAKGRSLEVVSEFVRLREEAQLARMSFARHHGGPQGLPYGTEPFFYGVAVPTQSPFTPGTGWRLAVRPERREGGDYRIYMPDMNTADGRVLVAKMAGMTIPDVAWLTQQLGSRVVLSSHAKPDLPLAQHWIFPEKVSSAWILHVPIPPESDSWLDGGQHQKGHPFHPSGAIRLATSQFMQLRSAHELTVAKGGL
jgi:hypothetical protein